MARKGRIDVPGAVHHITQRGINRGKIFWDDEDYHGFVKRMAENFLKSKTRCFAWSLMPNHIHLVLSTGTLPLRKVLQCIFTGHAISINHKYSRSGHLFEGRYKSILCEKETYLLELVRYVHLNPVKAGIVDTISDLAKYRWTGHRTLLGLNNLPWQAMVEVLKRFGSKIGPAREEYTEFLRAGLKRSACEMEITGQGMKRLSEGGWESDHGKSDASDTYADERIAGSRDFVDKVLKEAGERERWRSKMVGKGWTTERVIERAAKVCGIAAGEVKGNGKRPVQCLARNLVCKWLVDDIGKTETEVAGILGLTQPTVSRVVRRGRQVVKKGGYRLEE